MLATSPGSGKPSLWEPGEVQTKARMNMKQLTADKLHEIELIPARFGGERYYFCAAFVGQA